LLFMNCIAQFLFGPARGTVLKVLSTDANQSLLGPGACPLSCAEVAPLGKGGGTVELENGTRVEVALQIEVIMN